MIDSGTIQGLIEVLIGTGILFAIWKFMGKMDAEIGPETKKH